MIETQNQLLFRLANPIRKLKRFPKNISNLVDQFFFPRRSFTGSHLEPGLPSDHVDTDLSRGAHPHSLSPLFSPPKKRIGLLGGRSWHLIAPPPLITMQDRRVHKIFPVALPHDDAGHAHEPTFSFSFSFSHFSVIPHLGISNYFFSVNFSPPEESRRSMTTTTRNGSTFVDPRLLRCTTTTPL